MKRPQTIKFRDGRRAVPWASLCGESPFTGAPRRKPRGLAHGDGAGGSAEKEPIRRVVTPMRSSIRRIRLLWCPRINAPMKKFYVDRGSPVHAGQLLAELENRDIARAVTENQGAYQQAEASYQTALQKAQQDLKLAKEQLDAAAKTLRQSRVSFEQGAASAKDVEDARIALTQAQDQYQVAQKAVRPESRRGSADRPPRAKPRAPRPS